MYKAYNDRIEGKIDNSLIIVETSIPTFNMDRTSR